MKKHINLTVLCFLIAGNLILAQEKAKDSNEIFKCALEKAEQENKNVFIMFTASWCGWCKKMDASMNLPSIKKYFEDNYVMDHLVVMESPKNKHLENPGAQEMLEKFNGAKSGIPYWLIFDSKGNLLADSNMVKGQNTLKGTGSNIGCPGTKEEVDRFIYKIKETSNLKEKELQLIASEFRKNDPAHRK